MNAVKYSNILGHKSKKLHTHPEVDRGRQQASKHLYIGSYNFIIYNIALHLHVWCLVLCSQVKCVKLKCLPNQVGTRILFRPCLKQSNHK